MKHEDDFSEDTKETFLETQEKAGHWVGNEQIEKKLPAEVISAILFLTLPQVITNPFKKIADSMYQKTENGVPLEKIE